MIEKRTIIDKIEIFPQLCNVMQVRLKKQIIEDGRELAFEYHRTVVEPGVESSAQCDFINGHLQMMGYPEVEGWDAVTAMAAALHTPSVIAAYADQKAASDGVLAAA